METEKYEVYNDPDFKRFLRSLAKVPFTTAEEERELAARVAAGGRDAQVATKRLVESHMRLVVGIAARFLGCGVSIQDLVQEGTFGLYTAVSKYEPDKGRFKTYAWGWVRTTIANYIMNHARTVRVPINVLRMAREIVKASADGVRPSDKELAEMMGVDERRLREIESAGLPEVALDAPLKADGESETTIGELIPDNSLADKDAEMDEVAMIAAVRQALTKLKGRDLEIVVRRFGLDGKEPATLEDLAVKYDITRERIRQLQVKALEKLGAGKVGERLKQFLD